MFGSHVASTDSLQFACTRFIRAHLTAGVSGVIVILSARESGRHLTRGLVVAETETIYDRVGGHPGFKQIATDILALHHANPVLERRYGVSPKGDDELITLVTELLCSVTGGAVTYTGMNMHAAHNGMNINHEEFIEVLADISKALKMNNVSQADHDAIMNLNFGLKDEVLAH